MEVARGAKFEVYKDKAGEFRFRLKAGNGEVIAVGEGYKSKAGALNGIESIKRTRRTPRLSTRRRAEPRPILDVAPRTTRCAGFAVLRHRFDPWPGNAPSAADPDVYGRRRGHCLRTGRLYSSRRSSSCQPFIMGS
jgi:uncharacterized protein